MVTCLGNWFSGRGPKIKNTKHVWKNVYVFKEVSVFLVITCLRNCFSRRGSKMKEAKTRVGQFPQFPHPTSPYTKTYKYTYMRLAIYYPRTLTEKLRDGSLFWHAALYSTLLAAIDHHFWGRINWSLFQLEIWGRRQTMTAKCFCVSTWQWMHLILRLLSEEAVEVLPLDSLQSQLLYCTTKRTVP